VLNGLTAPDWRITLCMYTALHAIRALISRERYGYAGDDFNYESIPRVLQTEINPPQFDLATDFVALKKLAHKARYQCKSAKWLADNEPVAKKQLANVLAICRKLGINV
jgi:hypothetical protein